MKQTVVVIVGPTSVGKTKLSIEIAKKMNGEIISGDSMQIYKGMDIGTAKVSPEEMQGIPHYMIDLKEPDVDFSVADYQLFVQHYIQEVTSRNKLPILVGGSGLYIQATLYNYEFTNQKRDEKITKKLEAEIEQDGIKPLYDRLMVVDPGQAAKIHPNNHRRVIRALEVFELTGTTMSARQEEQKLESPYNIIYIGLEMERSLLYKRINGRVDEMLANGLESEVRKLYELGYGTCQSMKAIGYKEFIPYFEGKQTLNDSIELLKRNSRRFAKRQYTWFKNKMDINWYMIEPHTIDESFRIILDELEGI